MRRTDYETLAAQYDAPWRTNLPVDPLLEERLRTAPASPFRVLDVGCGTGAWLKVQASAFPAAEFAGAEPSAAMLAIARGKGINAELVQAPAEALPFGAARFDFIITRLAYHHFADKPKAFDEIVRVLKPGGVFVIADMAPERMPGWLVYQFFPEAYAEDLKRFLPLDGLQRELESRGCAVEVTANPWSREIDWSWVLGFCQGRGTSSLQILTEEEYQAGLARIRAGMKADPDRTITNGEYGFTVVATKTA